MFVLLQYIVLVTINSYFVSYDELMSMIFWIGYTYFVIFDQMSFTSHQMSIQSMLLKHAEISTREFITYFARVVSLWSKLHYRFDFLLCEHKGLQWILLDTFRMLVQLLIYYYSAQPLQWCSECVQTLFFLCV